MLRRAVPLSVSTASPTSAPLPSILYSNLHWNIGLYNCQPGCELENAILGTRTWELNGFPSIHTAQMQ